VAVPFKQDHDAGLNHQVPGTKWLRPALLTPEVALEVAALLDNFLEVLGLAELGL
jgi:hypothetical protein